MISKMTLLEVGCVIACGLLLASLIALPIAVIKKTKPLSRLAFATAIIATVCLGLSYQELGRIHELLFMGHYRVTTKSDLLVLFGKPTRTFSGDFRGEKIDTWVYKIDLISPKLVCQFEFYKDEYRGAVNQVAAPRD